MEGNEKGKMDRRALLAAGVAGAAALAVGAVMPEQAKAADGAPAIIGQVNDETTATQFVNQTLEGAAFQAQSTGSFGVIGITLGKSAGVWGRAFSNEGVAVHGVNEGTKAEGSLGAQSTGLRGIAVTDTAHLGLFVDGRVSFKRAGRATIAKGARSVSVKVPALSAKSMVLATLQTNRAGVYIQAAVAKPTLGKITIVLNKSVPAATKVAYFVLD